MRRAKLSLQVWVLYTLLLGIGLMLIPGTLLGIFQIEEPADSWVKVVGVLALVLTVLYSYIIKESSANMYEATVYGRGVAVAGLVGIAFAAGPWQLALFAAVDAIGALWTYFALRADNA